MRITLIYNEGAGGGVSAEELRREIEAGGHEIVAMLEPGDDLARQLDRKSELVVVAGGDGTVQRVATGLAGRGLPLAILPLGTANNIATSLGIEGSTEELIASWQTSRRIPIDLGIAVGPWGERRFIESVGAGLVARGIVVMDREAPHDETTPDELLAKALSRFQDVLDGLAPRRCRLTLDGATSESELLLVEVLNFPAIGPNLLLSTDADPSDGRFDVVTASEADRHVLQRYLDDRLAGHPAQLELPTRRVRRAEIAGWDRVHLDDEIRADLGGAAVSLRVDPAAVEILPHRPTHA